VIDFKSEKAGKAALIHIIGSVDATGATKLEAACDEWIAAGERFLVLDFTQVRYVSSMGLRAVLVVGRKLDGQGGRLIPCCLSGMVREVFQISGFDSLFTIFDSTDTALASV
jgi:anti-anti-sigma factor